MNETNIQNFVKNNLEAADNSTRNQSLNSQMSLEEIAQEFE